MKNIEFLGFRKDACVYLDVIMSANGSGYSNCVPYAYYKCHIEGTAHKCKKWGWCPLFEGVGENSKEEE
jgi:hypothetical protein